MSTKPTNDRPEEYLEDYVEELNKSLGDYLSHAQPIHDPSVTESIKQDYKAQGVTAATFQKESTEKEASTGFSFHAPTFHPDTPIFGNASTDQKPAAGKPRRKDIPESM